MASSVEAVSSKLFSRSSLPPLCPAKVWDPQLTRDIDATRAGPVLKATLHLLNDDIAKAHDLAQAHEESETANLVHAVLHRREGDYWNSKWWLSRITHPLVDTLHGGTKGAKRFVDDCERVKGAGDNRLQQVQWKELQALVEYAKTEKA